jgi:cytochrome P450 family 9
MQSQKHPDYYKNPLEFNPGRWLEVDHAFDDMADNKPERPEEVAWVPFGSGSRSCVGMRMALVEAKLFLFGVLSKFSVKPASETKLYLDVFAAPTLKPVKPLKLLFVPRK